MLVTKQKPVVNYTSTPLGLTGSFKNVPEIPSNLSIHDAHLLIPEGFEDIVAMEIDENSKTLLLEVLTDNNRKNTIITIDSSLFNPKDNGYFYPKFLIEREFKRIPNLDYFNNKTDRFIFNQNELLFIALQHRLMHFKQFKNAFGNLINSDVKSIKNFINHIPNTAYNAIQKDEHSYIILSLFNYKTGQLKRVKNNSCLGTLLKNKAYHPSPYIFDKLMDTLPIHYSSESMGEHSKYVLSPYENDDIYRSLGHKTFKDKNGNWYCKSLFPSKQNLPARNKTHVTANAYPIANFKPVSLLMQDYLANPETQSYTSKDECYIRCLVAIHPILDNNKFLYGEVEASAKVVETLVIERESITDQFEDIYIQVGQTVKANKDNIVNVGININNEIKYIENCTEVTLKHNNVVGALGVNKLIFNVTRPAGNARLDSNSGLKGVTVCKPNLGQINIPSLGFKEMPDLVFGMNSFKTKENGIAIARATLAVELGLYTPKKFGLLNTLDPDEVLAAAKSLPEYQYYDMFGIPQTVQIGVIYARFTELCYIYKSYRNQSFSFEAGRILNSLEDKTLFNTVWDNYVNPDKKEVVFELEKILLDKTNIYQEDIPSYSISQIQSQKLFTEKDLVLNPMLTIKSESKLLDEEWNKGFFLNLTSVGAGIVRIPSAKLLNLFVSQSENKMYMYSALTVIISRMLNSIIFRQQYFLTPRENKQSITQTYYSEINGMLYSDEDAAMMLIQTLSRPEVPGFAMKQNTDYILPNNTCVIFCKETYNRAIKNALGKDHSLHELKHGFYGLHIRSPVLWRKQICPVKIWNEEDLRIYLHHLHNIKLENYISVKHNRDLILFSGNVLESNQSDSDGDHACVFTPEGHDHVQKAIREYEDPHITQNELDWIQKYIAGERESNSSLINEKGELLPITYQLYDIPMHDVKISRRDSKPGFSTYLKRAIQSKGNIGKQINKLT